MKKNRRKAFMKTILFVCTGNTCRSSMAEGILKHMIKNRKDKLGKVQVISAGTYAWEGDQVSPKAVEVLKERGIDIEGYRSTPLTPGIIKEADLVLTMTMSHKAAVLQMCPQHEDRVFTLKEYILNNGDRLDLSNIDFIDLHTDYDIKDPFGQPIEAYYESADEIEEYLQKLVEKVKPIREKV